MNIFLQTHILNNSVAFRAEPVFLELEKTTTTQNVFWDALDTFVIFLQDWIYLPGAFRQILAFENMKWINITKHRLCGKTKDLLIQN